FLLYRRRTGEAILTLTAALPLVAWQGYIAHETGRVSGPPRLLGWIPLEGYFNRLLHPASYDLPAHIASLTVGFDYIALIGMGLAVGLGVAVFVKNSPANVTAHGFAVLGFTVAVIFLRGASEWADAFAFGRIFAPLLLLLALSSFRRRNGWPLWLALAP